MRLNDLTGRRFGRLMVKDFGPFTQHYFLEI